MNSKRLSKDYMSQLSLALKSITDSQRGVAKHQLMRLIGLDPHNASDDKQLHRLIERLQALGYPITYNPDLSRYTLDRKRIFDIEASSADLTLLKTAIRHAPRRSTQTALVLENALAKLHATGTSRPHSPNLVADIPAEDLLLQIVSSIEKKKRVRFAYRGAQADGGAWRVFDPYLVFSRARVFYVCGRARPDEEEVESELSPDGFDEDIYTFDEWDMDLDDTSFGVFDVAQPREKNWQWRTYRISRIDADTYEEIGERSAHFSPEDAHEKVSSFFEVRDVLLEIRPHKAHSLRAIAEKIDESHPLLSEGWDCYRIKRIDRRFLFERLMTYGNDVHLLAPDSLRNEWAERLRHLVRVGVSQ